MSDQTSSSIPENSAHATSGKTAPSVGNIHSISFKEDGSPFSEQFNDIYFDTNSGCHQSEQVFIKANNITQQLLQAKDTFVVAETGFGTGLNFLLTLQAYQKAQVIAQQNNQPLVALHFISVEKYPLTKNQLEQSLAILPELSSLAALLLKNYPESYPEKSFENDPENKPNNNVHAVDNIAINDITISDFQESFLDNQVTLQLIFKDATEGFSTLKNKSLVNAWYLDGFSPTKNPDMWQADLFAQIARLSKPQATLSTFTVAGFVRRLLNQAGFRTTKKTIESHKAQCLIGKFQQNPHSLSVHKKGYQLRPSITKPQQVSMVGGGIASACAAYALTKQGIKVTLYCKDSTVAQGASSNAVGALYPLLHQQADDISLFYQQAFWRARALYQELTEQGYQYSHDWCGLLDIGYKEALQLRQQRFAQENTWPSDLIHLIDEKQATNIAKIPLNNGGLFMPNAGWIAPQELVKQLFNAATKTNRLRIIRNIDVQSMEQQQDNSWIMKTDKGNIAANILVMCGGAESIKLSVINQLPFGSVRGQVTSMKSNNAISNLSTVICHKGYLTPASHSKNQPAIHCIGATFDKNSFDTQSHDDDNDYNLNMLKNCLPELPQWQQEDIESAKARLRCSSPDHLPVVGAMPDIEKHKASYPHLAKDKNWPYSEPAPVLANMYMLMGLGARGLCSAPLLADILTADLCGTPYPVDNNMLFNLSPNRFIIRDIVRRKTTP